MRPRTEREALEQLRQDAAARGKPDIAVMYRESIERLQGVPKPKRA